MHNHSRDYMDGEKAMRSPILKELREYISKNGIAYEHIAKQAGMSKQLVWYYLNGRRPGKVPNDIKLGALEKICHALGFCLEITLIPESRQTRQKPPEGENV